MTRASQRGARTVFQLLANNELGWEGARGRTTWHVRDAKVEKCTRHASGTVACFVHFSGFGRLLRRCVGDRRVRQRYTPSAKRNTGNTRWVIRWRPRGETCESEIPLGIRKQRTNGSCWRRRNVLEGVRHFCFSRKLGRCRRVNRGTLTGAPRVAREPSESNYSLFPAACRLRIQPVR